MRTNGGSDRHPDALPADARGRRPAAEAPDGIGSGRQPLRFLAAFGDASRKILREDDLDTVCRLFLEAVRQHSGYRRVFLSLWDEQGRDARFFFSGFSDEEIDHFHGHKPGPMQLDAVIQEKFRIGHSYLAPATDFGGFDMRPGAVRDLLFLPLPGTGTSHVGAAVLFDPCTDARPTPEDLAPLELFAGQLAHSVQKRLLDQKIKAMQSRLLAVQAQLMQAEKMSAIGLLISGVAHELNNPLSGIMGFAQLLLQNELNPKVRKNLERIHSEAVRSQKIVQNLLSFARRHKPEKTYQNLNEVIEGVLELRSYQLKVDNVEVVRRYDTRLPKTMLDFHQLQQVILNVVNNAHQAMMEVADRPRRLVVTTERRGPMLRASFADSGTGIASDRLESIFDPFFTTKMGSKGTGLGLSVSRAIVKDHQGTMSAESAVGEGTRLHIDLPLLADGGVAALPGSEGDKAAGPQAPLRLMVVDDEQILVELLAEFLKTVGHKVDVARNGQKALELATANDYDAILTDLKMPGLDGQGLYERLCAIKPHMARRFIFSTGDLANPRTQSFFQIAGCPYLSKPFKLEAVLKLLEQIVQAARAA